MGGSEKKVRTARSVPNKLSTEWVISVVASSQTPPYFSNRASPENTHQKNNGVRKTDSKEKVGKNETSKQGNRSKKGQKTVWPPLFQCEASDCIRLVLDGQEIKSLWQVLRCKITCKIAVQTTQASSRLSDGPRLLRTHGQWSRPGLESRTPGSALSRMPNKHPQKATRPSQGNETLLL